MSRERIPVRERQASGWAAVQSSVVSQISSHEINHIEESSDSEAIYSVCSLPELELELKIVEF
jgi:hypothetical protein